METFDLTNHKAAFTISGKKDKMSAEILKVSLKDPVNSTLRLFVTDENGFELYSKPLIPEPSHPNAISESKYLEVAINKRFIFSAFITVSIQASDNSPFSAEVHFIS